MIKRNDAKKKARLESNFSGVHGQCGNCLNSCIFELLHICLWEDHKRFCQMSENVALHIVKLTALIPLEVKVSMSSQGHSS
jgi:hypothetical protein